MKWLKLNDVVLNLVRRKNDQHILLSEESKFWNTAYLYIRIYIKNKNYIYIQMLRKISDYHESGRDSIRQKNS